MCVCVFILIFYFILYIYIYIFIFTTFVHEIGGFKNCKNTTKDLAPRIDFTNLIRLNVLLCIWMIYIYIYIYISFVFLFFIYLFILFGFFWLIIQKAVLESVNSKGPMQQKISCFDRDMMTQRKIQKTSRQQYFFDST